MPTRNKSPLSKDKKQKSIRELHKEQTVASFQKAALEVFLEKGYLDATVADVARNAGASRATFYLHFSGKWEVLAHLVRQIILPETLVFYRRLDKFGIPSRLQMRVWLTDAFTFYEKNSAFMIIYKQASSLEPDLVHLQSEIVSQCASVMKNYLARWGEAGESEARLRLHLLIIQLADIAMSLVKRDVVVDKKLLVEILVEYWSNGLRDPKDIYKLREIV